MIHNPPPFKGLHIRIPIIAPTKVERGLSIRGLGYDIPQILPCDSNLLEPVTYWCLREWILTMTNLYKTAQERVELAWMGSWWLRRLLQAHDRL